MLICYVTDRKLPSPSRKDDALLYLIKCAGAAGVDWIQIREKDLSARELLELTRRAITAVPRATKVLINDRIDVAIASRAAGVHLGTTSIPVADAVRWCRAGNAPKNFHVGVSCHWLQEAREAERSGADYVFFGPVYDTPSKMHFGPAQGIARLAEVCRSVKIPVLAIGGINEDNAAACFQTGAAGVAAIRLFQDASDAMALEQVVARLRKLHAGATRRASAPRAASPRRGRRQP